MKILIALDSSSYADEIVHQVASRSWPDRSEFLLMTAVPTSHVWEAQDQYLVQSGRILEKRAEALRGKLRHCSVSSDVIQQDAHSAINQAATDWDADLVVIGSHGDTGYRASALGSVAAAVANKSPCSVEIIKLQHLTH